MFYPPFGMPIPGGTPFPAFAPLPVPNQMPGGGYPQMQPHGYPQMPQTNPAAGGQITPQMMAAFQQMMMAYAAQAQQQQQQQQPFTGYPAPNQQQQQLGGYPAQQPFTGYPYGQVFTPPAGYGFPPGLTENQIISMPDNQLFQRWGEVVEYINANGGV